MNLRRFCFLFSGVLFSTSACSVYKSAGRKSFESKAPDQIKAQSASQKETSQASQSTCWVQPASQPLWHVDATTALIVKPANEDEIQVCFQEAP